VQVRKLFTVILLALFTHAMPDAEAAPAASDPALDRSVAVIASELRCLVCQNQSIADSNAPLAIDLRNQIREQLSQGRSESEIRAYMAERYGDFVLYRPPLKLTTAMLWVSPLLLLVIGLVVLYRRIALGTVRHKVLSAAEQKRASALLGAEESKR
jgi:cytochrome c-type biogenesis protein CcmH